MLLSKDGHDRRTVTSYLTTNPVTGVNYLSDTYRLLRLPSVQTVYDAANVKQAETVYEYDRYASDGNNAPMTTYTSVTMHDTANYGAARTARGNPTRVGTWLNTNNTYIYAYARFDMLGNGVSAKDARGNVSTVSYIDDYGIGVNPGGGAQGPNGATYAFPTLITSPPPTAGAAVHTARSQYDFSSGQLTGFMDRNGMISQMIYDDPFNRPTWVKAALGTPQEVHSKNFYAGASPVTYYGVTLTKNDTMSVSDFQTANDAGIRSWTKTDGYGRTVEAWKYDTQGDVRSNTIYDALGRAKQVSNPYRPSLSEPIYYTTNNYDMAGRAINVTTPDGAVVSTNYASNAKTVTDQAGRQRRGITDALGRTIRVIEDPNGQNLATDYLFDTVGNLRQTLQGVQNRYFMYDSLGRLIRARQPEQDANAALALADPITANSQWSVAYAYDNVGNIISTTDSRGISVAGTYDNLNRMVFRDYSDVTPDVTFRYDDPAVTFSKGKLTKVSTSVSETRYMQFNNLGRLLSSQQVTSGQAEVVKNADRKITLS